MQALLKALPEILTQFLAFLVVFWVLKKYVFAAMFKVMDERKAAIAQGFQDIERKKTEIETLEKDYRVKIQHIEQEARTKIQEALTDAGRVAQEIREKARQDSLKQLERAKADIQIEMAKARVVLRNQIVELSTRMAEKVVRKNISMVGDEAFSDDIMKEVESDILGKKG